MNRTSRDIERKVFQLHFQGDSNYTISLKLGIPTSTVSDILSLLPESITPLQDLAKDLKKQNLTIFEAKRGTQLRARLDALGVSFDRLQSFSESAEKMSTNPDYTPKQIVQGAMRLNDLEEESGKKYSETLLDFEEKKEGIKALETMENQLKERVDTLKTEEKRRLAENNVTESEIAYIVNLRQNLHKYGARLNDVENLRKYLENMKETGGNPQLFVEYTKNFGSLNGHMDLLRQKEQEQMLNLQGLRESTRVADSRLRELHVQINEAKIERAALNREVEQAKQEENAISARIAVLLEVEPEAEKIVDSLGTKQKELAGVEGEILEKTAHRQDVEQQVQELTNKKASVEKEVQNRLKINDYATQLQSAITNLELQKLSLETENSQKRERLALADTITAFLTRQSSYDFNSLYSKVQLIKTMRESRTYQTSHVLLVVEEETRLLALKAFEGDLASKKDYQALLNEKESSDKAKEELETRVRQLESNLQQSEKSRESTLQEKQLLETVRMNFEGGTTTLAEVRNWILLTFGKEIERRVEEKHNATAAAVHAVLDFVADGITRRGKNRAEGGQL